MVRRREILASRFSTGGERRTRGAFTLVELVVVISIISLLMGILVPVLSKVRRRAKGIKSMSNQREIVNIVTAYSSDNCSWYPASVAKIGPAWDWNWQKPTWLTGPRLFPGRHRAMSEYLGGYIKDASIFHCPSGPRKYKYLQGGREAGDEWDNPDTPRLLDSIAETYCFYWNYLGHLESGRVFAGPRTSLGGRREGKILVTCYFGYDHWRSPGSYGSCERFKGSAKVAENDESAAYWASKCCDSSAVPVVKLLAGYVDGHVGGYLSSETVAMRVSKTADGSKPYSDGGPGIFYLPEESGW